MQLESAPAAAAAAIVAVSAAGAASSSAAAAECGHAWQKRCAAPMAAAAAVQAAGWVDKPEVSERRLSLDGQAAMRCPLCGSLRHICTLACSEWRRTVTARG